MFSANYKWQLQMSKSGEVRRVFRFRLQCAGRRQAAWVRALQIQALLGAQAKKITEKGVWVEETGGTGWLLPADTVILAIRAGRASSYSLIWNSSAMSFT